MNKRSKEWRQIAFAFYALAHNDPELYLALPENLKNTPEGQATKKYMDSKKAEDRDAAGKLITGTKEWYVYLGRS